MVTIVHKALLPWNFFSFHFPDSHATSNAPHVLSNKLDSGPKILPLVVSISAQISLDPLRHFLLYFIFNVSYRPCSRSWYPNDAHATMTIPSSVALNVYSPTTAEWPPDQVMLVPLKICQLHSSR